MIEKKNARAVTELPTRREAITGFAIAMGSLAVGPAVWGKPQQKQPKMEEKPSTGAEGIAHFPAPGDRIERQSAAHL